MWVNPMNQDITINKANMIPIYEQIKNQITGLIQTGQIKTGDQLPTIRELALALSVNVNTVALAYRDLAKEQAIITARGKGTYVARTPGEEEMQAIRYEILMAKIDALLRETDRLGYNRDEVGQAFDKLVIKKDK
jgi:GntR family transcriptional regulator